MADDQPSTSTADINDREEIVQLWRHLDETLETKAKSMNLTSLNVKSILHHLIKYPSAVDIMMGIQGASDVPNMRLTRSQRKTTSDPQDEQMSFLCAPKTFLDLDFDDNDEFDEDYAVSNKSDDDEEEEDEEEEEEEEDDEYNILDPYDTLDLGDANKKLNSRENLNDSLVNDDFYNIPVMDNSYDEKMKNPEYRDFLNAVRNDNAEGIAEDDPDDEDYDVQVDDADLALDVDDWYENRHDRAAQIPRYEVERLMMDTILAEKEIPLPKDVICTQNDVELKKTQKQKDAEVAERVKQCQPTTSCSLLVDNVTFQQSEIDQLKMQLEQHVQLLTQFVVTCYHDQSLYNMKNEAQFMINELDQKYFDASQNPLSIYNIPNLAGSIESCHDIINMEEVDLKYVRWAHNPDGVQGSALRPEVAAVLSRSLAIRYPHLLPKIQPSSQHPYIPFNKSEDIMLALGLLQFVHLPRRCDNTINLDRYTAIHKHCLPARTANKIRNHMKTIRCSGEKASPLHEIIIKAEQGISKMDFAPTTDVALDGGIQNWQSEFQPNWYKKFINIFKITNNKVVHIADNQFTVFVTPTKLIQGGLTPNTIEVKSLDEAPYYLERGYMVTIAKITDNNYDGTNISTSMTPGKEMSRGGMNFGESLETPDGMKTTSRMSLVRPRTPVLGDGEDSQFTSLGGLGETDFSHLVPAENHGNDPEASTSSSFSNKYPIKRKRMDNVSQHESDDDSNKKWRKRTRVQKEMMGKIGMEDQQQRDLQKVPIARKIAADVKKRLFMHQEKYLKFVRIMNDKTIDEQKRVLEIIELFRKMPEIMHLVLIFVPVEFLPDEILSSPMRHVYKEGIEMIIDINGYFTSAKIKTPSVRQIFKLISKVAEKDNTSAEAAGKMYQLFGNERPLWERIEKYFHAFSYKEKCKSEDFEFINLSDDKEIEDFEYIDDVNSVNESKQSTSTSTSAPAMNSLFTRSGQLMVATRSGVVPIEIRETKWSKRDDMILLSAYNQAINGRSRNPIEQVATTVTIPYFDKKIIENRLNYLLKIINE